MKNKIIIILVALIGLSFVGLNVLNNKYKKEKADRERLEQNQRVLLSDISTYKAKNGELITRTEALQQTERELKKYNSHLLSELSNLRIRPKDLKSHISVTTETKLEQTVPIRDTVLLPNLSAKSFTFQDDYTTIRGVITDSVKLTYHSTDSIQIFQHIQKHKFLFIRWGVKAEWWDVKNENPANTITGFKVVKVMH
jgi:DNA repair exonuclease SbcCD ATPase subunit